MTRDELPECPVATTVQLIGNKWKLLIIRNLMSKPQRFTEFVQTIPGISKKVLTDNLRSLEEDGLVNREVFAEARRVFAVRDGQNVEAHSRRNVQLGRKL